MIECAGSLRRVEFGEILRRVFLEISEAVFAAEFDFLPFVDEHVGLPVLERFISDDALIQRIRLRRGRAVRMTGVVVMVSGTTGEQERSRTSKESEGEGFGDCIHSFCFSVWFAVIHRRCDGKDFWVCRLFLLGQLHAALGAIARFVLHDFGVH